MIRFSKYYWVYISISLLVLVPGLVTLVTRGLRPSIDFTGGTILEMRGSETLEASRLHEFAVSSGIEITSIQAGEAGSLILRMKSEEADELLSQQQRVVDAVHQEIEIVRNETVGPTIGQELLAKAVGAAIVAILGILLYVAYAFKSLKYGVCAVLALFHDLFVVLGLFALLGAYAGVEVDTLFVTAFLTTMSFSVHDTIVVFDRIREYTRKGEKGTFVELTDRALTETMGRSLANSFTIIFMLLALVLLGGLSIRWFAVALLVGTISGTYSSPFVATPLLVLWDRWERTRK